MSHCSSTLSSGTYWRNSVASPRRRAGRRCAARRPATRAARCAARRSPCAGRWRRRRTRAAACGCRSCAPRPCVCALSIERVTIAMLDRLALGHLQHHHDAVDALAGEDAQQRILERQVEARAARIALAAGAAAQLVVDAPRLVALGADDVQAAGLRPPRRAAPAIRRAASSIARCFSSRGQLRVASTHLDLRLDVAAEHDVGAAAGHVGGDGDHLRPARLRDDLRLARVLLRVQHLVRQLLLRQQSARAARSSRSRWCRPAPAGRARGSRGCRR